jgi:hypothetical protein
LPRPSSALKPSHSPDSVACPGLGGICLAFDETLRYLSRLLQCCVAFAFGLCMVSCELVPSEGVAHSPFTPIGLRQGLHFFPCNLKLLDLLEAPSDNISVASCAAVVSVEFSGVCGAYFYGFCFRVVWFCAGVCLFAALRGLSII